MGGGLWSVSSLLFPCPEFHGLLWFHWDRGWGEETRMRSRQLSHSCNLVLVPSRLDIFQVLILSHRVLFQTLSKPFSLWEFLTLKTVFVDSYWLLQLVMCEPSLASGFDKESLLDQTLARLLWASEPGESRLQPWSTKMWTNTDSYQHSKPTSLGWW